MRDKESSRGRSFGASASAYARHRPDYPLGALHWILAGSEPSRVVDLAAGTGKLTEGLVALRLPVSVVEPDTAMLAELTRRLPDVPAMAGTAERIPLADHSLDAVFVGQAFHWFDTDAAFGEIARVLRPGGTLALLWNDYDDEVPWVAELVALSGASGHRKRWTQFDTLPTHPRYSGFERARFPHLQRRTAQSLTDTIATYSLFTTIGPAEGEDLLGRIHAFLAARQETAGGFDLPMTTTVLRARTLP